MKSDRKLRDWNALDLSLLCFVAVVTSACIQVSMHFPLTYTFKGRVADCRDISQGMTLEEVKRTLRRKASPEDMVYSGDILRIQNRDDVCTISFSHDSNRVEKIENSYPPVMY